MSLSAEQKKSVITKYGASPTNTGSIEAQIALLTARLEELNGHFKIHSKDYHSKQGLLKLVGARKKLMRYLNRKNPDSYKKLITDLGVRG